MSLSTQEQKTLDLLLKKKYGGKNKKYSADPNQGKQKHSANLSKDIQSLTNKINGLEFQLKNIANSGPQIPRPMQKMTEAGAEAILGALARVPAHIPPRPPRPSNPSKSTVPSNSLKMRKAGDNNTIFRCPEVTGTNHSQKVKNYVHLCRSFTYGGGGTYTCKFGNRCHFYHPDPRNMCPQGANCLHKDCRNFHPHEWYVPK